MDCIFNQTCFCRVDQPLRQRRCTQSVQTQTVTVQSETAVLQTTDELHSAMLEKQEAVVAGVQWMQVQKQPGDHSSTVHKPRTPSRKSY